MAPGVLDRHASVAGSSAGPARSARSLPAGLGPTALGGVVVVEPDRVTPDSRGHPPAAACAVIADPLERKRKYEEMVAAMYEKGKALNAAALFEIDDVIDPADTRRWIMAGLRSAPPAAARAGKKHAWIDAW